MSGGLGFMHGCKLVGSVPFTPGSPMSVASEDDRLWFEKNPKRRFRLRLAVDGEWAAPPPTLPVGARLYSAVHQVAPGARMRRPVWAVLFAPMVEPGEDMACDAFMRAGQTSGTDQWTAFPI